MNLHKSEVTGEYFAIVDTYYGKRRVALHTKSEDEAKEYYLKSVKPLHSSDDRAVKTKMLAMLASGSKNTTALDAVPEFAEWLTADLGLSIGKPKVTETHTGTALSQISHADYDRELQELRDGVGKIPGLPQITLGFSYRF